MQIWIYTYLFLLGISGTLWTCICSASAPLLTHVLCPGDVKTNLLLIASAHAQIL